DTLPDETLTTPFHSQERVSNWTRRWKRASVVISPLFPIHLPFWDTCQDLCDSLVVLRGVLGGQGTIHRSCKCSAFQESVPDTEKIPKFCVSYHLLSLINIDVKLFT
ncbi:hypothetical protein NDU88_004112, partial [Pleurodeles waltl]